MKKKIAITGGIGSGKSTVLREISKMGYPVFSCDEIYKEIMLSQAYVEKIYEKFPQCIKDGTIDRKILSEIVFQNEKARKVLNDIAHPLIMQTLFQRMNSSSSNLVFAEVPLLFEGDYENLFDNVIVVLRDTNDRVKALIERDHTSEEKIKNRINTQFDYFSEQAKLRYKNCNAYILNNKGEIEDLTKEISKIIPSL